jgi:hypothetical protein
VFSGCAVNCLPHDKKKSMTRKKSNRFFSKIFIQTSLFFKVCAIDRALDASELGIKKNRSLFFWSSF